MGGTWGRHSDVVMTATGQLGPTLMAWELGTPQLGSQCSWGSPEHWGPALLDRGPSPVSL